MSLLIAVDLAVVLGALAAGFAYTLQFRRLWQGRVADTDQVRAFRAAAARWPTPQPVTPARILATTAVSPGQQAAAWGGFIWIAAHAPRSDTPDSGGVLIRNTLCHEGEHLRRHHGAVFAGAFGVYIAALLLCAFLGSASGFVVGAVAAVLFFPTLSRWQERQADQAIARWGDPAAFCATLAVQPADPPLPWPWGFFLMTHPSHASRIRAVCRTRNTSGGSDDHTGCR